MPGSVNLIITTRYIIYPPTQIKRKIYPKNKPYYYKEYQPIWGRRGLAILRSKQKGALNNFPEGNRLGRKSPTQTRKGINQEICHQPRIFLTNKKNMQVKYRQKVFVVTGK